MTTERPRRRGALSKKLVVDHARREENATPGCRVVVVVVVVIAPNNDGEDDMLLKSPLTVLCVIKREVFSFFADESHETLGRTADVFHQFSRDLRSFWSRFLVEIERYDVLDPKKRVKNGPKPTHKKMKP